MNKCNVNNNHVYCKHLTYCPWCAIRKNTGKDFFPATGRQAAAEAAAKKAAVEAAARKLAAEAAARKAAVEAAARKLAAEAAAKKAAAKKAAAEAAARKLAAEAAAKKAATLRGYYKVAAFFFLGIVIFLFIIPLFDTLQQTAVPSASNPDSQIPVTTPITTSPAIVVDKDSVISITFDKFPNGNPITNDVILKGDEFKEKGILVAGVPGSSYCANATSATIDRPPNCCGIPFYFLTATPPTDVNRCNTVPVAITFISPVTQVSLIFAGANATYTMQAFDENGKFLGTVQKDADVDISHKDGTFQITFNSSSDNIKRVTFGRTGAITAIKEIQYVRLIDKNDVLPTTKSSTDSAPTTYLSYVNIRGFHQVHNLDKPPRKFTYNDSVLNINKGDTIIWEHDEVLEDGEAGKIMLNVKSEQKLWDIRAGQIKPGKRIAYTFYNPGTYTFQIAWKRQTIIVSS